MKGDWLFRTYLSLCDMHMKFYSWFCFRNCCSYGR